MLLRQHLCLKRELDACSDCLSRRNGAFLPCVTYVVVDLLKLSVGGEGPMAKADLKCCHCGIFLIFLKAIHSSTDCFSCCAHTLQGTSIFFRMCMFSLGYLQHVSLMWRNWRALGSIMKIYYQAYLLLKRPCNTCWTQPENNASQPWRPVWTMSGKY